MYVARTTSRQRNISDCRDIIHQPFERSRDDAMEYINTFVLENSAVHHMFVISHHPQTSGWPYTAQAVQTQHTLQAVVR